MGTLASLNIVLSANAAGALAGFKKTQAGLSSLSSCVASAGAAFARLGTSFAGLGAALAGGLAVGGLASMVKSTIDSVDAVGDLAAQLGMTTEALTRLQYTADVAGSSAQAVGDALGFMNKNLGQAAAGGAKHTAEALADLGLNARQLASIAPDQAFAKIAQGISRIGTVSERSRLAVAIFGKSGQNVLNVLALGSKGMLEAANAADRLGYTLSSLDSEKVGLADRALKNLGAAFEGIKRRVTVELTPYIIAGTNKLVDFGTEGRGAGNMIIDAMEKATKGVAEMIGQVTKLGTYWDQVRRSVLAATLATLQHTSKEAAQATGKGGATAVKLAVQGMKPTLGSRWADELIKDIAALDKSIEASSLRNRSQEIAEVFRKIREGVQSLAQSNLQGQGGGGGFSFPQVSTAAADMAATFNRATAAMRPAFEAFKGKFLDAAAKNWDSIAKEAEQIILTTRTPAEKLAASMDRLGQLYQLGAIDFATLGRAQLDVKEQFAKAMMPDKGFQLPGAPAAISRTVVGQQRASSAVRDSDRYEREQVALQRRMAASLTRLERKPVYEPKVVDIN